MSSRVRPKVNKSHAWTTLLYLSYAFTMTFTQNNEVGIHALQTEHLKIKSPKNLKTMESLD